MHFDKFYSELKHILQTRVIEPKILTTLFMFIEGIFEEEQENYELMIEKSEFSVLAVNQVSKNFNEASLLDLAFAFSIASEGKDQIFMHKFSKKVAAKIARIDVESHPKLSLRCLLNIMYFFL